MCYAPLNCLSLINGSRWYTAPDSGLELHYGWYLWKLPLTIWRWHVRGRLGMICHFLTRLFLTTVFCPRGSKLWQVLLTLGATTSLVSGGPHAHYFLTNLLRCVVYPAYTTSVSFCDYLFPCPAGPLAVSTAHSNSTFEAGGHSLESATEQNCAPPLVPVQSCIERCCAV